MKHAVAFLLDADNTLLDNDRIIADLLGHIEQTVGPRRQATLLGDFRGAAR